MPPGPALPPKSVRQPSWATDAPSGSNVSPHRQRDGGYQQNMNNYGDVNAGRQERLRDPQMSTDSVASTSARMDASANGEYSTVGPWSSGGGGNSYPYNGNAYDGFGGAGGPTMGEAPPVPPQNSLWHRQVDAAQSRPHAASGPRSPPSVELDQSRSSSGQLEAGMDLTYGSPSSSRPTSSATGIINLYSGDDDVRFGSDSSDSELPPQAPRASRRISARPLPPIPSSQGQSGAITPSSSGSTLALPASTPKRVVSPFAPTVASAAPSPQPYPASEPSSSHGASVYASHLTTPPMPQFQDGYFPSASDAVHTPDNSYAQTQGSRDQAPLWSPATSSFAASSQTSPTTDYSLGSLHRPKGSLGAMSVLSADSWVSGDGNGRHKPGGEDAYADSAAYGQSREAGGSFDGGGSHSRRANAATRLPHVRVESESGALPSRHETVKRRAPLPTPPRSATRASDTDYAQTFDTLEGSSSAHARSSGRPIEAQFSDEAPAYQRYESHDPSLPSNDGNSLPRQLSNTSLDENRRLENRRTLRARSNYGTSDTRSERTVSVQPQRVTRTSFVDFCQLSHIAVLLKEKVPRGMHVKGSIEYPSSFTGQDVVTAIEEFVPKDRALVAAGIATESAQSEEDRAKLRHLALELARSLKGQLFFNEVDWGTAELQDGVDEVYLFLQEVLAPKGSSSVPSSAGLPSDLSFGDSKLDLSLSYENDNIRDHPVSSSGIEELPTGVFVPLTTCYSPSCGRLDSPPNARCYSPSCPRSKNSTLQPIGPPANAAGWLSDQQQPGMSGAAGGAAHKAWAELVPPEVLANLPKSEITRQNAILEHIQKEEDFLADLELLETLFIRGLEKPSATGDPPPIPIGPERDDFIREVFGNHRELVLHVRRFVEKLHIRQREESPIVQSIGDLFLNAALDWHEAFVTYVSAYPIAKSRIGREQSVNPRFRDFLEQCRREPACRRLGLDNFIHRALPHLQRHPLLLQTIIDKTDSTIADRDNCIQAKEVIVQQCKTADTTIQAAQVKAKIRDFAYNLQTKRNKAVIDMDLLNSERQLVHEGRVYRRPDFTELDWTELQAVLFDNYFAVTKLKAKTDGAGGMVGPGEDSSSGATFVLAKRPIPVEMLEMSGFNEPSASFSLGLNALHLRSDRESRSLWPFTIHHLGGKLEPLTLYATSKQRRTEWHNRLEEARAMRKAVIDANQAFRTINVCDSAFTLPNALMGLDPDKPLSSSDATHFHGRITCAAPFSMADGRKLMALGCADGVWIGLRQDPASFRKVLHLKFVTQCAVLEEFGIFVVLADKVLISYSLEALVPTSTGGATQPRPPQKLSGNRGVLFFGVGVMKDRTLLVYMKKKANESVFKALEPVINQPSTGGTKSSAGNLFTKIKHDMSGRGSEWFRMYKVFFIPSEAYTMQFLRSKLAIVCARGFEIMNLDTLLPGTIPDFSRSARDDPRIIALARRVETAKPLGLFKLSGTDSDFLLCYDAFACYVDRSGEPIRLESVVEWEGTPSSVAFRWPYVLAFDSRFVEIRDAMSGRLVQIMRGSDMRYISGSTIVEGSSDVDHSILCVQRIRDPKKNAIKGASTSTSTASAAPGYDKQQVFELVPTNPVHLERKDTTATTSTGLLSYSNTMNSTRSFSSSSRRGADQEGAQANSSGTVRPPIPTSPTAPSLSTRRGRLAPPPLPTSQPMQTVGSRSASENISQQQQQQQQPQSHQQRQYQQMVGLGTRDILPTPLPPGQNSAPAGWI